MSTAAMSTTHVEACTDPGLRRDDGVEEAAPQRQAVRVVDSYGSIRHVIDDGGPFLEGSICGVGPDGEVWDMPYWLPRDAVTEVLA